MLGLTLLGPTSFAGFPHYKPEEGDVVFQPFPRNPLTDAIEGVTNSDLSHCGVVIKDGASWVVIEAVNPVVKTPLNEFIARGREQKFLVKRLDDKWKNTIPQFKAALLTYLGKPYDIRYQMSDDKIYCSELVYKGFKKATGEDLGKVEKLGDLNWKPHEAFIREIEHGPVPLEREMITPVSVSKASQLKEVFRNGY
ncbi:MAG TPA: YiiX/YebB-like N1pC/P60 family cysteine hydrolase [Candidatus Methylacidiphilales bacterium]|nr:YiiX/YebB-like N1pC/P60 family cysteine hydrolase [Candidatus Methylacidiphilales bacterium]